MNKSGLMVCWTVARSGLARPLEQFQQFTRSDNYLIPQWHMQIVCTNKRRNSYQLHQPQQLRLWENTIFRSRCHWWLPCIQWSLRFTLYAARVEQSINRKTPCACHTRIHTRARTHCCWLPAPQTIHLPSFPKKFTRQYKTVFFTFHSNPALVPLLH